MDYLLATSLALNVALVLALKYCEHLVQTAMREIAQARAHIEACGAMLRNAIALRTEAQGLLAEARRVMGKA